VGGIRRALIYRYTRRVYRTGGGVACCCSYYVTPGTCWHFTSSSLLPWICAQQPIRRGHMLPRGISTLNIFMPVLDRTGIVGRATSTVNGEDMVLL